MIGSNQDHVCVFLVCAMWFISYTVAHSATKRARILPIREVHARQETVEHEGHSRYGDLSASFESWQARGKKRRTAGTNHKVSVMARYLLGAWGFGVKSAHEVQREAAMAVADGADHPDLVTLAGLGTAIHDANMGYMRPALYIFCGRRRCRGPSRAWFRD